MELQQGALQIRSYFPHPCTTQAAGPGKERQATGEKTRAPHTNGVKAHPTAQQPPDPGSQLIQKKESCASIRSQLHIWGATEQTVLCPLPYSTHYQDPVSSSLPAHSPQPPVWPLINDAGWCLQLWGVGATATASGALLALFCTLICGGARQPSQPEEQEAEHVQASSWGKGTQGGHRGGMGPTSGYPQIKAVHSPSFP